MADTATRRGDDDGYGEATQQGEEREKLFDTLRSTSEQFIETIRQKMKSVDLSELEELGYDREVIREAADNRFEEARL